MIEPVKALDIIAGSIRTIGNETVSFDKACGRAPSHDLKAIESYPYFSNSAMDGFAVLAGEIEIASETAPICLKISDTIYAGAKSIAPLNPGCTVRVMTGAPVPTGTWAVVKKEDVQERDGMACFRTCPREGQFINRRGEEIAAGKVVWHKGEPLNPASTGLLATLGYKSVEVFSRPKVAIIVTGDELVGAGSPRKEYSIYDSISLMLEGSLKCGVGIVACSLKLAKDTREQVRDALSESFAAADVVLCAGGASVGDKDYVVDEAIKLGVKPGFQSVRQKPGKPLFFGKLNDKVLFCLPGNPVSAVSCVLLYVLPALRKMSGWNSFLPRWESAVADERISNGEERWLYARGRLEQSNSGTVRVKLLRGQSSYMLTGLAGADVLVEVPPGPRSVEIDELLRVYRIPWNR